MKEYAIVDLMGHCRIIGLCSEVDKLGVKFLRVEVEGKPDVYFSAQAIFSYMPIPKEEYEAIKSDEEAEEF